jgi:hypothetical protein
MTNDSIHLEFACQARKSYKVTFLSPIGNGPEVPIGKYLECTGTSTLDIQEDVGNMQQASGEDLDSVDESKPKPQLGGAEVDHGQDCDYGQILTFFAHSPAQSECSILVKTPQTFDLASTDPHEATGL